MINNNVFPGNACNTIHQASSLSISLSIESRNRILASVTHMFDNLQTLLLHYNKAFTFSIQSLSNDLNHHSLLQHQDIAPSVWQNTSNHIQSCLVLQEKMWKDILHHKATADSELSSIHNHIRSLQQQKLIFINPINTFHLIPTIPITTQTQLVTLPSSTRVHINATSQISSAQPDSTCVHYIASDTKPFKPIPSDASIPSTIPPPSTNTNTVCTNTVTVETDPKPMNKRKRKRRGYNGPYSAEERQFMIDFNDQHPCDTTTDIIALSDEIESRFKVKRSPYGLAQKMYHMNIINSRLKALFQRKFEDEDKEQMALDELKSEQVSSDPALEDKDTDAESIHNSYGCIKRWRPFVVEEVQFMHGLIQRYHNENSRKLYWRFLQRFVDWKDDSKSYQRFYHKYWTLVTEQRNKKNINGDTVRMNHNDRKRTFDTDTVNEPCKRFKASCNDESTLI